MLNRDSVVPRPYLIERVYDGDAEVDSNSVEVILARLRKKIAPARIEGVRGHGYRLTDGAS
jgi:DNA-binding response OmpR family regulator